MALGAVPTRLAPGPGPTTLADGWLHPSLCPYMKRSFEHIMRTTRSCAKERGPPRPEALVFTTCCDAQRRACDIFRHHALQTTTLSAVWMIDTPRGNDELAVEYYTSRLEQFVTQLEEHYERKLTAEALQRAMGLLSELRHMLDIADRQRASGVIEDTLYYRFIRRAQRGPKAAALRSLRQRLKSVRERSDERHRSTLELPKERPGPRLVVVGSALDYDAAPLLETVRAAGATIVGDDLCTGSRYHARGAPPAPIGADDRMPRSTLLRRLARETLQRRRCPRHASPAARTRELVLLFSDRDPDGVIVMPIKCCDTMNLDLPAVYRAADACSLPVLHLEETLQKARRSHQHSTRLEAFLEMI